MLRSVLNHLIIRFIVVHARGRSAGQLRIGTTTPVRGHIDVVKCLPLLKMGINRYEEWHMNQDQVKGAGKDLAGKVQEEAGKVTGDKAQQTKGLGKQISGKVQKGIGDVKETFKNNK